MLLIDNAEVRAPAPLGRRSLLLGGKVLWMGWVPRGSSCRQRCAPMSRRAISKGGA